MTIYSKVLQIKKQVVKCILKDNFMLIRGKTYMH